MGGDLNLKKSWHPNLRKNQERVWKEEKQALEERKLIEKVRREREEEAEIERLKKLQEAAGGKVAQARVEWMYSGPGADGTGMTEDREGYLLGKRKLDSLLKANDAETKQLAKGAAVGIDAVGGGNVGTARDVQSKVSQDPLLLIQKQKMEMQLKLAKDAQRRQKSDEKRAKEKERERKHRHKHSRRDRSRSRDSSEERERRHRHRHRSRSPRRRDRDDRDSHRRRDRSVSRDSSDERDRRHRHRHRSRSRSPYRRDREDRDSYRKRSRSQSPRRRDTRDRRDEGRERSRSPPRKSFRDDRNGYRPQPRPQPPVQKKSDGEDSKQSMADKLAAMQADANSLEEQRNERVRLREAEDAAEEEKHKKNLDSKGSRFISGMRSKAVEGMSLGDAMAGGRQRYQSALDV